MFSFFKRSDSDSAETAKSSAFDPADLKSLFQHFPIGRKLRYYPEFQRDIVFTTLVIAYRINDQFIYSRDAVLADTNGLPTGFQVADGKIIPFAKLTRFQVMVPDTSAMEGKLDYFTRAELGRTGGQFRQGNAITLMAETSDRGIPTVDTRVDRRQVMPNGPYANNAVILLIPEFDTLKLADKRQKQRVQSAIAAALHYRANTSPLPCVLADFAESTLRLDVRADDEVMPEMQENDVVIVDFSIGGVEGDYRLRGKLFRRAEDFCVIKYEFLFRDGNFEKLGPMDIMEIKTGLLNLGT